MDDFWLWLYTQPGVGSRSIINVREQRPQALPREVCSRLGFSGSISSWRRDVQKLKESLDKEGIVTVPYWSGMYPRLLREISDYPAFLFCRGDVALLSADELVTIVGTRDMSEYGVHVVDDIVAVLAMEGIHVVSGLANGIDSEAHRCLISQADTDSRPVAVLPGGPGGGYPRRNGELFANIVDRGCAVWEFVPGTPIQAGLFALRNRILAGLTRCSVVIESDEKGGSLITARSALENNRDVGAVPGSIYSVTSRGTNRLVQDGAFVIRTGWDVVSLLRDDPSRRQDGVSNAGSEPRVANVIEALRCPARLHSQFQSRIIEQGIEVSRLVDYSVLDESSVARVLTKLEIAGILRRDFDGKIKLTRN